MTLKELQNEVLSLMFETSFDDYTAFIAAANRALSVIHSERDRTEVLKIYKRALKPSFRLEHASHRAGTDLCFKLSGSALSFTAVGNGKVLFTDGENESEIDFSGNKSIIKKIIRTGNADLVFSGGYDYDIYELCSFDFLKSSDENEIPIFEELESFDIKKYDARFIAFSALPEDSSGRALEGARAEGRFLRLPRLYEGEVNVYYKRAPRYIKEGDIDGFIDVSDECSHLLPLLCAAYLLFDDNEGLSDYYLSLYKNGMSAVKVYNRSSLSSSYRDVLGWAR